jgi:hypothetical protein
VGWRVRLDAEGDGEQKPKRAPFALAVLIASAWVVVIAIVVVWLSGLISR